MKNIIKLIMIIGLLMQHGVAQASWMNWINDELLGAKQAKIAEDATDQGIYMFIRLSPKMEAKVRDSLKLQKDDPRQEANKQKIKEIEAAIDRDGKNFFVVNAYAGVNYIEKRRNFIRSFATFGLSCLYLPQSESEKKYQDFKTKFNTTEDRSRCIYSDENICHWAIEQFNREQRVYQNRVVAAAGVVLISAVAGYLLANKK